MRIYLLLSLGVNNIQGKEEQKLDRFLYCSLLFTSFENIKNDDRGQDLTPYIKHTQDHKTITQQHTEESEWTMHKSLGKCRSQKIFTQTNQHCSGTRLVGERGGSVGVQF